MNGKTVRVSIKGTQVSPEGDVSRTDSQSFGVLREKDGRNYLLFSEKDEDGAVTRSVVKYDSRSAQIIRSGAVSSGFTFDERKHCRSSCIAPYGSFLVDIDTERYVLEEKAFLTKILIGYRLAVEGEHTAQCVVEITIRPDHD